MTAPNLVYILADDMGYGDLSCLNSESKIRTRHLDAMAAGGMIFSDGHASSAVCTPSRYSILTGRYNWRSTLKQGVIRGYSGPIIESGRMTVASFLKAQGYRTACVGKWHLGMRFSHTDEIGDEDDWAQPDRKVDWLQPVTDGPLSCGFDRFFGISASLDMPPYCYLDQDRPTMIPDGWIEETCGKGFWRKGEIAPDFRHEEVLQRVANEGIAFMEQSVEEKKPFFLYLPLPAPHTPILPTEAFAGKSGTNAYGDFCLQVDDVVEQVRAALDRLGVRDESLLVFTSDNGCSPMADFQELADKGHHPSYVFRGHKADIYEGGHRVPLLMEWPSTIRAGSRCDETVCLVDLLATCADIVGDKLPDHAGEDSVSNLPLLRGEPMNHSQREATVHHSIDGSFSIRKGRWKLEMCPGSGGWSHPKPGPDCEGLPPVQLYDLEDDVGERRNLQAEHPDVVRELQDLLTRYVRQGRSTPGVQQDNTGGQMWQQLWWMDAG